MSSAAPTAATDRHLATGVLARLVGVALMALALVVFVLTALVAFAGLPVGVLVVVVAAGALALGGGTWWVRTRTPVVRLDGAGYEVRLVRGCGVRQGRWSEVTDVAVADVRGVDCLVLRRRDGAVTSIPLLAVEGSADELVAEVRRRLAGTAA